MQTTGEEDTGEPFGPGSHASHGAARASPPIGFDPSRGEAIWRILLSYALTCIVFSALAAVAGMAAAMWFSAGFIVAALTGLWEAGRNSLRDSDGSTKGADACGSVACDDSAGPKDIAQPKEPS